MRRSLQGRTPSTRALGGLGLGLLLCACHSRPSPAGLPITPQCRASQAQVHPGDAVALDYLWEVGATAPRVEKGFGAFVHFVDSSGTLVFADDHPPVPPPEAWDAGQTYRYRRIVLVPDLAPKGPLEIRMGLFSSTGTRLALSGPGGSRNEYRAGALSVQEAKERAPLVWEDGFYPPEALPGDPFASRRWMQREGRVTFRNRGNDVLVALSAETNHTFPETPVLTFAVGRSALRLPVTSPGPFLERVRFRGRDLGGERHSELRLTMSLSFVPRLLGLGNDPRELSLWIHGLLVEDVGRLDPAVDLGSDQAGDAGGGSKVDVSESGPFRGRSRGPAD